MKNLLFWSPFIGNVGTRNAVLQSAKALSKKYNCKVINVFGEFNKDIDFLNQNQIQEIRLIKYEFLQTLPKKGFIWSRLFYTLVFILSFYPLLKVLKQNKKNYIFIYLISSLPLLIIKLFNLNNKIIFRVSGKININFFRKLIYTFVRNKIYKILVQTSNIKNSLKNLNIFEEEKIIFCEDPIINLEEIEELKISSIESKFQKEDFYVAIGRLTKQKNFSFLIEAIKRIPIKKFNGKILILGDGEEKKLLLNKIKTNNLTDRVYLLGYKNNIYKYIYKSKGLICCSLWEEPGFIIQEAAACKKIILTSNCPNGPEEFLEYGKNGYVFKSNNFASFEKQFFRMLKNKSAHKKMINENYKKIFKYTKKSFENRISKILQD